MPDPNTEKRVPTATEVEAVARHFHDAYERMAPGFGYKTREESAVPWEQVPQANRLLMVAVAGEVLQHLLTYGTLDGRFPPGKV